MRRRRTAWAGGVMAGVFGAWAASAGRADVPAIQPGGPAATQPASAPAFESVLSPEGCRIEKFSVASPSMGRPIRAVVVLPPGYDPNADRRYPVLYALQGMGAPYTTWSDMSPLRRALKTMPMILASFDGDRAGWYIDSTQKADSKFTTFLFQEFIPHIESHYRAGDLRGVTGFSMGGYGAMHYVLTHPDRFASVSALSASFRPLIGEDGRAYPMLGGLLGDVETNRAAYEACGIHNRLAEYVRKGVSLPPMMIHCGTEDGALTGARAFRDFLLEQNAAIRQRLEAAATGPADPAQRRRQIDELMARQGLRFEHVESPGGHAWPFWRDASRGVVEFHWRSFQAAEK